MAAPNDDNGPSALNTILRQFVEGERSARIEAVSRLREVDKSERELRESEEKLIRAEVEHLREMWQLHDKLTDKALDLQAQINKEHLDALNHVHEQTRQTQQQYMPREKFEEYITTQEQKHNQYARDQELRMNDRFGNIEKWKEGVDKLIYLQIGGQQRQAAIVAGALVLVTILSFVLPRLIR